jgi:hypothetical protein
MVQFKVDHLLIRQIGHVLRYRQGQVDNFQVGSNATCSVLIEALSHLLNTTYPDGLRVLYVRRPFCRNMTKSES